MAEVTAKDLAEGLFATGIPVSQPTQEERERLVRLEEQLSTNGWSGRAWPSGRRRGP